MQKSSIIDVFELHKQNLFTQRTKSIAYRRNKLELLKSQIIKKMDAIEVALEKDFGKAKMETVMTEVMPVITMLNLTLKNLSKWSRPKKVRSSLLFFGSSSKYYYQSKGNVLIIGPWNYPFQLTLVPIITAFSTGNTIILKPSEFTENINQVIREICKDVFDQDEFAQFEGEANVSQALLDLPFDHIFFTGSTQVGKIVMEKASKHLASVTLELGGKSPVIIADDIDLKAAAKNIIWGKFVNGGQTCVAPDYIFVPKSKTNELIKLLIKEIENRYGQDIGTNEDFCQSITPRHASRLLRLVKEAREGGAKIHTGGEALVANKVAPTILSDVTDDMEIMKEEIFGPLLPIKEYDHLDEVLKYISQHDNPLALYLFTNSEEVMNKVREYTSSGSIGVNETLLHVGNMNFAFGGAGKSGIGRYHGKFGFEEFSNIRSVAHRKFHLGLDYFFPPYTTKKYNLLRTLVSKFNRFL